MTDPRHPFNLAKWVNGPHNVLILDDPVPLKPPTAEQLAARRAFLKEHCDSGAVVLESRHRPTDYLSEAGKEAS